MAKKLPTVLLRSGEDRRVRAGHPWAFSNEIFMDAETKAMMQTFFEGHFITLRVSGKKVLESEEQLTQGVCG